MLEPVSKSSCSSASPDKPCDGSSGNEPVRDNSADLILPHGLVTIETPTEATMVSPDGKTVASPDGKTGASPDGKTVAAAALAGGKFKLPPLGATSSERHQVRDVLHPTLQDSRVAAEKFNHEREKEEGPCAAVSARAAIKVVQVEAFKMKIDASTSCAIDAVDQVNRLLDVVKTNLDGTGKWGEDCMARGQEIRAAMDTAMENFKEAEKKSYRALRCTKRCGKCALVEEKENTPAVTKLIGGTQTALIKAKTAIVSAEASRKAAVRILDLSKKNGAIVEDAKKTAKIALDQTELFLKMAEDVADGAWYTVHDDGLKAGQAAAKHWLQTIGAPGEYMKEHSAAPQINGWPKEIPRGKRCHIAQLQMKAHAKELEELRKKHDKKVEEEAKRVTSIGGLKLHEQKQKQAVISKARLVKKGEEASKRPDTCRQRYALNMTAIPRSGCMHGCNARLRQFTKYASPSKTSPPPGIHLIHETLEDKALRRQSRIRRIGVMKWLEQQDLKETALDGKSLPAFIEAGERSGGKPKAIDAATMKELRKDLLGEMKKENPNIFELQKKASASPSTRDIMRAVIHNANLEFDEKNPVVAEELVARDDAVLQQLIKEGIVLGDERQEHPPPNAEIADPTTVLHSDDQCPEFCEKTRSQVLKDIPGEEPDAKTWTKACTLCCSTVVPAKSVAAYSKSGAVTGTEEAVPCGGVCKARQAAKDLSYLHAVAGETEKDDACEDLRKWHPCLRMCETSQKTDAGIDRSGCINGCREALLRGIPSVKDCAQYCDETVDQIFLKPDEYGYDIYKNGKNGTMPKDANGAKDQWVRTCVDSCKAGWELRDELFSGKNSKSKNFCQTCPTHCEKKL